MNIITIIISVLALGLSIYILWMSRKRSKTVEDSLKTIGDSEGNDEDRSSIITKAEEQIRRNTEAIRNAKKVINDSDN